jgi:hypothetical protein
MNKAAHSVLLLAEAGGDLLHYGAAVGGIAHVLQVSNQSGGRRCRVDATSGAGSAENMNHGVGAVRELPRSEERSCSKTPEETKGFEMKKESGGSTARSASRNLNKMEKLNAGKRASVIAS